MYQSKYKIRSEGLHINFNNSVLLMDTETLHFILGESVIVTGYKIV